MSFFRQQVRDGLDVEICYHHRVVRTPEIKIGVLKISGQTSCLYGAVATLP